jgi:hypothetical protein
VRDYNADEKIDWHDYYLKALTPVQTVSIKLGNGLGQKLQDTRSAIHAKAEKAEAKRAKAHREQLSRQQAKLLQQNTDMTRKIEQLTERIHAHLGITA